MILVAATAAMLFGAAATAQAQQVPYSVCKYPKVCPPGDPMPMPPKSSLPAAQRVGVGHTPDAAGPHKRG
jgi:hypothetical protein